MEATEETTEKWWIPEQQDQLYLKGEGEEIPKMKLKQHCLMLLLDIILFVQRHIQYEPTYY